MALGFLFKLCGQTAPANFCGTNTSDQQKLINIRQSNSLLSYPESGVIYIPIQVHILRSDVGNGGYNIVSLKE